MQFCIQIYRLTQAKTCLIQKLPADIYLLTERVCPRACFCSQDYGYWGNDDAATGGCPTPDMGSCFIAVDRCTRENGCLQLLKGSQRGGRLQHLAWGEAGAERTGVLPETADEIRANGAELVEALLEPGDAIFFHSNTLHHSEESSSDPRWALCVQPVSLHLHADSLL